MMFEMSKNIQKTFENLHHLLGRDCWDFFQILKGFLTFFGISKILHDFMQA